MAADPLHEYEHAGLRFQFRDAGQGRDDAVVCLHGAPQDHTAYDGVVARLVAHGQRVLVPDQRGYSPGARPTGRSAYAMPALVGDVIALLDATSLGRVHLVGHDWGGAVAWVVAGRHPERIRSLTVLSTPHPAALRSAMTRSSQGLRSVYMGLLQLPWLPEHLALAGGARGLRLGLIRSGLPADRAAHYARRMQEPGALAAALGWYRSIGASRGFGPGRIRVPTTYLWGTRDPFFARAAARRSADFVIAPYLEHALDAGHWLPENNPAQVADAVLLRIAGAASR
ncbi:MAG: alpha/beta fold hydrolase [Actinomycetes bacterium]